MVTAKLPGLIRFTLHTVTHRSNRVLSKNERGTDTRNAMNSRISYKVNNHNLDKVLALLISYSSSSVPSLSHFKVMSLRSMPQQQHQHFKVTFPHERVVQVTLNRPEKLNSITQATSREIQKIWELFDQDESLWVGIITGSGRAFCTGADLHGIVEFSR